MLHGLIVSFQADRLFPVVKCETEDRGRVNVKWRLESVWTSGDFEVWILPRLDPDNLSSIEQKARLRHLSRFESRRRDAEWTFLDWSSGYLQTHSKIIAAGTASGSL
jgi:hypothetical protein